MMRKKRGYKRDTPKELYRDYKLFAIACEGGKREPEYFSVFEQMSKRIKVDIIEDKIRNEELGYETKSAPNWVLDRAIKYIEKEGLIDEDDLWFILDVDRWEIDQIRRIANYCDDNPNWHIVLSNPCFEVWLYFHKKSTISQELASSCKQLKQALATLAKGGYSPITFIVHLEEAISNAKNQDENSDHFLPIIGTTKLYQLGTALLQTVGTKTFEEFILSINQT